MNWAHSKEQILREEYLDGFESYDFRGGRHKVYAPENHFIILC